MLQDNQTEEAQSAGLSTALVSTDDMNMAAESETSFVCQQFSQDYAETFACDFNDFYSKAVPGESPPEQLPINSLELYQLLFVQEAQQFPSDELRQALKNFISHTYKAEQILSNTCFLMIKKLIDCLQKHNGSLRNLDSMVSRIRIMTAP